MLLTPHALTGFAIAKATPDLLPAALAAVTLHFILDYIPHKDMLGGQHVNSANIWLRIGDLALLLILFFMLIPAEFRIYSALIGIVAILPDIIELPGLFWKPWRNLPVIGGFHHWHTQKLQYDWPKINWWWGLLPQLVLVGWCMWYLNN